MLKKERIDDITIITEQDSGKFNNVVLIEDSETLTLVDTFMSGKLMKILIKEVIEPFQKPVTQIIFTHWHIDHTLGACFFNKSTIIATEECASQLIEFKENHYERLLHKGIIDKDMQVSIPNRTINKDSILHCENGQNIFLIPLPGHSHDALIVGYRDFLIVGDTLVGNEIEIFLPPVIPPDAENSKKEDLLDAIQYITKKDQWNVVSGHGARLDKETLITENLSRINNLIQK